MDEGRTGQADPVGDSSAASFMNQIKAVLDQQLTPPEIPQQPQSADSSMASSSQWNRRLKRTEYILPSKRQADSLLDVYWRLVDTLYPFLDKDDFTHKYHSLWIGRPVMEDEIGFLCLMNVIFSISCILDPSIRPCDRVTSAEIFYRRAQAYLDLQLIQHRCVQTVQCFLLLAQYLQSTNDPQQCWLFAGLAIRIAQSLGLDLPSTSERAQSARQRNLLRKVWHGCVLMDRTLSMTFGRPAIITSQAAARVPHPAAHPDISECFCHRDIVSTFHNQSPDIHFFIESLKLYEAMGETLLALYNPEPESGQVQDSYGRYFGGLGAKAAGTVLEIDRMLSNWNRNLPLHLRYENELPKSPIHARQTKVLWLRYCQVRMLLFRPVLSRFCKVDDDDLGETLARKLALQCSVMCVQSALNVTRLCGPILEQRELGELDEIMPSWWYSIFYLYTAATVLVAARLNPTIEAEVGPEVVASASRAVSSALNRYESFVNHAKRCATAVSLLFDQIPRQQRQQRHPPQTQSTVHEGAPSNAASQRNADTQNTRCESWSNPVPLGRSTHISDAGGEQAWMYDRRVTVDGATPEYLTADLAPSEAILDASDFTFDLGGDMSWLSSIPFELYGEM